MIRKIELQKKDLLEILANLHFAEDDFQVIIDDEDGIYFLPALRGFFYDNKKNQQNIERINQIFKDYLQDQFLEYPLEFQKIISCHLDELVGKAYQNLGWDRAKMAQRGDRITVGFLKMMLKELKEIVAFIGKNPSDAKEIQEIRRLFSQGLNLSDTFDSEARDRIFSIFKAIGDRSKALEILSFNKELYIPEVLVAEYLTKIASCYGFEDGELVKVPFVIQKNLFKNQWKTIQYRISILPLWKDVFAYGFLPETDEVPQILLFCGSDPLIPARKKATSFSYLKSKGLSYLAYKSGEKVIEAWLQESFFQTKQKAVVLGNELGGALVGYTTTYLHPFVQKGMTFNGLDVDEQTTRFWKDLEGNKDRPQLHNFYLPEDAFYEISHQTIGENYDILREATPLTQLDSASQLAFDQNVVLCRHRGTICSTVQKISSVVPLIGTVCLKLSLFLDWVQARFSSKK